MFFFNIRNSNYISNFLKTLLNIKKLNNNQISKLLWVLKKNTINNNKRLNKKVLKKN